MTAPNPIQTQNLTADRNADFVQLFTWVITPSQPSDLLTGAGARFIIHIAGAPTIAAGSGIVIASNTLTVTILKAQLALMPIGNTNYDFYVDFLDGITVTFMAGGFTLL